MAKNDTLPEPDLDYTACVVDCATGEQGHRDFTPEERAEASKDWWEQVGRAVVEFPAAEAAEKKKAQVLDALANTLPDDVSVDDVRAALRG